MMCCLNKASSRCRQIATMSGLIQRKVNSLYSVRLPFFPLGRRCQEAFRTGNAPEQEGLSIVLGKKGGLEDGAVSLSGGRVFALAAPTNLHPTRFAFELGVCFAAT